MSVINGPVFMPTKPYFIWGEKRGSQLSNYLGSPNLSCSLGRTLRPISPALEDVSPDFQLKSHHCEIRVHSSLNLYQVIMGERLSIFFLLYSFCVEAWGELLSNLTNFWSTLAVENPRLWVAWMTALWISLGPQHGKWFGGMQLGEAIWVLLCVLSPYCLLSEG